MCKYYVIAFLLCYATYNLSKEWSQERTKSTKHLANSYSSISKPSKYKFYQSYS